MRRLFNNLNRKSGFSLIELLIAVSITAFLSVGIFSVFSQGLKVWKRAVAVKPDVDADIIFEKITGDLRGGYSSQANAFEGSSNEMIFWSFGKAAAGTEGRFIHIPRLISYKFDETGKKLLKSEETLKNMLAPGYIQDEKGYKELLAGLKECRFEYYHENREKKTYQWKSFWKDKCLPKAVRVSLKYDDEHSVGNYSKVVALPAQRACTVG